jgi:hypothetical protein
VGREMERYVREREEEIRKQQGGRQELLVWFYTTGGWGRRCKQTDVPQGWTSADIEILNLEVIYLCIPHTNRNVWSGKLVPNSGCTSILMQYTTLWLSL